MTADRRIVSSTNGLKPGRTRPRPTLLELRIHGVRNTPPHEMLECPADGVRLAADAGIVQGDSLAGFYERTERARGESERIRTEAYSWGGLARTSPKLGFLKTPGRAAGNLGWLLLVPFGLTNAAYWARPVRRGRGPGRTPRDLAHEGDELRAGPGAGLVRLFALALTLLYTTSFATAALDVLGAQVLTVGERGPRLALLTAVPVLAVGILMVLSRSGNARYLRLEPRRPGGAAPARGAAPSSAGTPPAPHADAAEGHVLAAAEFWERRFISSATGRVHVGASLALLAVLLCADQLAPLVPAAAGGTPCRSTAGWFAPECYAAAWDAAVGRGGANLPFALLLIAGAAALLLGAVLVVAWSREMRFHEAHPGRSAAAGWYLAAAFALTAAAAVYVWRAPVADDAGRAGFAGTSTAALVILGAMTILALAACLIRYWVPAWLSVGAITLSTVFLLLWAAVWTGWLPLLVPLAVVLVLGASALVRKQGDYREQAWAGAAPGVLLFLSLFGAAFLASALPVGLAEILRRTVPGAPEATVPAAFAVIGGLQLAAVGLVGAVFLAVMLIRAAGRRRILRPLVAAGETGYGPEILKRRALSAIAHRGEPALGIAALAIWAAITVALLAASTRSVGPERGQEWLAALARFFADSVAGWGVLAGTAVVLFEAVRSARSEEGRPLPLLWDLMCWMPRAAHPFGPACYAERAVPEISDRILAWLDANPRNRVLVAAHSLGAVLTVSSLFELCSRSRGRPDALGRIQVLSYGMQLRPYFGRLFPELFGPAELGIRSLRRPALFAADPWWRQQLTDDMHGSAPHQPAAGTLLRLMGHDPAGPGRRRAWLSLWRRTDYLGFPFDSYASAPGGSGALDRYVQELEPNSYMMRVATHGNYLPTAAYAAARSELLARM